ncbi:type I-E CRISPR-associated protein Cas5/CasD [Pseudorhodobacter sp. W20_MBD10_FR17]|uniref:type I-E CRISPR-associated protein Cas5/CasD n=1 Tax=Pseudorhodobacter sp. W20_MBD10_FR17 TaxID=3240266 RepID=UPI003F96D071
MQPHLVFTLTASLGATGELAGHERRGSLGWPGRSAVLGLVGAAMGIKRGGDFSGLDALSLAVAIFDEGVPLRDYHTVQTIPSAVVKSANSRPEALAVAGERTNTTITLRDYRAGPLYGVALWNGDLGPLCAALARPQFTLYLGRKSCPLSAPLAARIVSAEGPEAALAALTLPPWLRCRPDGAPTCAALMAIDASPQDNHRIAVHDVPLDRCYWHFAPRQVALRRVNIQPQGAA